MMKTEDFNKNLNSVSKMLNEKMQTKNRQQPDRSHYRLALPDPKQFIQMNESAELCETEQQPKMPIRETREIKEIKDDHTYELLSLFQACDDKRDAPSSISQKREEKHAQKIESKKSKFMHQQQRTSENAKQNVDESSEHFN